MPELTLKEQLKPLNKQEQFVCEMIWGGTPVDVVFVRNSKKFQQAWIDFTENGKWKEFLWYS